MLPPSFYLQTKVLRAGSLCISAPASIGLPSYLSAVSAKANYSTMGHIT